MDENKNEHKKLFDRNSPVIWIFIGGISAILAGVIILFFVKIFTVSPASRDKNTDLQQKITDYANEQQQNDMVNMPQAITAESSDVTTRKEDEGTVSGNEEVEESGEEIAVTSDTIDKVAVVVDIEDETDVSYTKEYILKEMMPYFEANNLEAVWDLSHLKRYVKLSESLKGTETYYYQGDVDSAGLPDGKGLAIYEANTYYYGEWSHGVREGNGRWCRFYINASDKLTKNKKYQAHSYAGNWKNDLPNGSGAEHYDVDISKLETNERIIQNVVGNFADGLYDDYMYANTVNYIGVIEEWYGTAKKGVFESWEDIGRRGEYYAWQNKDDNNVYIAIYRADNKNQGIREMLDLSTGK